MSQHAALLARYKHLRQVAMGLNSRLMKKVTKSALEEGGKKLGIFRDNIFMFESEDQTAVLMDYCIHDVRQEGHNAIDRFLEESPPPAGSDELVVLQAYREARYSVYAVEGTEPGVGVQLRDLLRDELLFVMDVGFSQSASRDLVLAARLFAPEGIWQTTGAALPIGVVPLAKRPLFLTPIRTQFKGVDFHHVTPEKSSELATFMIRLCLEAGAMENVQFQPPGSPTGRAQGRREAAGRATGASPSPQRRGRNSPCGCGSGKKYKHCCGARK
jgi:hypothetical protein